MNISITIDGKKVQGKEGQSLLLIADTAGVYIPRLCYHPDLAPAVSQAPSISVHRGTEKFQNKFLEKHYEGCNLCLVKVSGMDGFVRACDTDARDGMEVITDTAQLKEKRKDNLMAIMALHPHACLTCAQNEGCSLEPCSTGVPMIERCCAKFENCELRILSAYVGIKNETPGWLTTTLPVLGQEPLFTRDYNLCIGCTRCVRACREISSREAMGYVLGGNGRVVVGSLEATLKESNCNFCTVCVQVCPTGALMDKEPHQKSKKREAIHEVILPPEEWMTFNNESLRTAPDADGVYLLADDEKNVFSIKGVGSIRQALLDVIADNTRAKFFKFEQNMMYTQKETEYIQKYGLAGGDDDLDDLF